MKSKDVKLFGTFIITLILMGIAVSATVVGPNGIYDGGYFNGTLINVEQIFIDSVNLTASILAGGSGWDGTGALFQNGTRELTDNWDVGSYNVTADNFTAQDFYLESEGNLSAWVESIRTLPVTYTVIYKDSSWKAINSTGYTIYDTASATTTIQNAVDSLTTGHIFVKDPGSTIVLTSNINVDARRILITSDWATIQSAAGEYAFNFSNSHGFGTGNPFGGLENWYISGNSRNGHGLIVDRHQGGSFRNLVFSSCDIAVKFTLTSDFTEGNTLEHVAILSPNYGIIFEGTAGGTGSFMDTAVRDIRINLDVVGSTGIFFDAANGNVKPHNSRFENIHMWLKTDFICGMNFSDGGSTVQLWDTGFFDLVFELYNAGTENCTGIYVGDDVNVDKFPYWVPMPRFINTLGSDWTHASNDRIDNSNDVQLGPGLERGHTVWTPDGTKIYRIYVTDLGAVAVSNISGNYD